MPYIDAGYEPEPQDVHPDCWVRIRRQGNTIEMLISREGETWTSRAKFDIEGDYSDFMVPVILPLPEYKPSEEYLSFRKSLHRKNYGKSDEEDIS
jgi:hypothetical protein